MEGHAYEHSGTSVTAGYCPRSTVRRRTWYDCGDGTFVKRRVLQFVCPTHREVRECHLLLLLLTPQWNCQRTYISLFDMCLSLAALGLLTYLLQSSHFIPFLISKLWFSLHTSSCFDIRFASQDFKIHDFKLLNRANEWLSLRKCWNIVSYFNRHVIQTTPPAVAALFTLNDSERLYLLQTLSLKPGCISYKSLEVHSVIFMETIPEYFPHSR